MNRYIIVILGLVGALVLDGCSPDVANPSAMGNLTDLSQPISSKQYDAPYEPEMNVVRLVVADSGVGLVTTGGQNENASAVRAELTDVLTQFRNFRVLNRSVSREAQAEWQLAAKGAANRAQVPSSVGMSFPDYIIKPTLAYVERNIRSNSGSGEWSVVVSITGQHQQSQGAVELILELIDVRTLETVTTVRAHGLLYDKSQQGGLSTGFLGGAQSESIDVPEAEAIREAAIQGSEELFRYLRNCSAHG